MTGIPKLWHTKIRTDALGAAARAEGIESICVEAGYTREPGAAATRTLLRARRPPTAISRLSAAQRTGVDVPSELSIVARDDSPLCELVHPPLTALSRDIAAYGTHAARTSARVAGGEAVGHFQEESPVLTLRGGSASPPPEGPEEALRGT